jgi:hypothetical protein
MTGVRAAADGPIRAKPPAKLMRYRPHWTDQITSDTGPRGPPCGTRSSQGSMSGSPGPLHGTRLGCLEPPCRLAMNGMSPCPAPVPATTVTAGRPHHCYSC